MLFSHIFSAAMLVATSLASPITPASDIAAQETAASVSMSSIPAPSFAIEKRAEKKVGLPDGNTCEIEAVRGTLTENWTMDDYARLFYAAGQAMVSSITRNRAINVGLTMSFRDHRGHTHQVDCEVTNTYAATVSLAGAHENVGQALVAAEQLADDNWNGWRGSTRASMLVYFGNVAALSIAVAVIS